MTSIEYMYICMWHIYVLYKVCMVHVYSTCRQRSIFIWDYDEYHTTVHLNLIELYTVGWDTATVCIHSIRAHMCWIGLMANGTVQHEKKMVVISPTACYICTLPQGCFNKLFLGFEFGCGKCGFSFFLSFFFILCSYGNNHGKYDVVL